MLSKLDNEFSTYKVLINKFEFKVMLLDSIIFNLPYPDSNLGSSFDSGSDFNLVSNFD